MKKSLVKMLTDSLNRRTPDCLMLILTFLRKLSIFDENKDLMASNDVNTIFHLAKFVPCSHDKITQQVLRLLFNLSFDKSCRTKMVEVGFLPKLVDLLKKAPFRAKTVSRGWGECDVSPLLTHARADPRPLPPVR